jgi:hypothetical protein
LVAEDASPVGVADALPRRSVAVSVLAPRIRLALVAEVAPPSRPAIALVGIITFAVDGMTARLANSDIAGGALPPLDALLVAVGVADVMSELVVSWPAELGAGGVVIMTVAFDPHPVGEPGPGTPVVEGVPLSAGIDDARIRGLFYDVVGSG